MGYSPWDRKESDMPKESDRTSGILKQSHHFELHSLPFLIFILNYYLRACFAFPGGSDGKVSAYNAGGLGSIPGPGRSPEEGNGNPLQYSCLENPMDGGAWLATVHGVSKSRTRLSDFTITITLLALQESCLTKVS